MNPAADTRDPQHDPERALGGEIRRELLDRLSHFQLAPQVILELGAVLHDGRDGLGQRFRDARIITITEGTRTKEIDNFMQRGHARPGARWLRWLRSLRGRLPGVAATPEHMTAPFERLPLADASTDLVVGHQLILGGDRLDLVLAEVRRVLKSGGLFLWTTLGPGAAVETCTSDIVLVDMHDIGGALSRAGFVEPVLDIDRLVIGAVDAAAAAQRVREVIHVAAFAGGLRPPSAVSEAVVAIDSIGRRRRKKN